MLAEFIFKALIFWTIPIFIGAFILGLFIPKRYWLPRF